MSFLDKFSKMANSSAASGGTRAQGLYTITQGTTILEATAVTSKVTPKKEIPALIIDFRVIGLDPNDPAEVTDKAGNSRPVRLGEQFGVFFDLSAENEFSEGERRKFMNMLATLIHGGNEFDPDDHGLSEEVLAYALPDAADEGAVSPYIGNCIVRKAFLRPSYQKGASADKLVRDATFSGTYPMRNSAGEWDPTALAELGEYTLLHPNKVAAPEPGEDYVLCAGKVGLPTEEELTELRAILAEKEQEALAEQARKLDEQKQALAAKQAAAAASPGATQATGTPGGRFGRR